MRVSCVWTVTVGRIDDDVRVKEGKLETGGRLGYLYFATRHNDSRALNSQSCQGAATRTATVAGSAASWRTGPGNASTSCSVCTHVSNAHRLQAWLHGTPVFRVRQLLTAARGLGGVIHVNRQLRMLHHGLIAATGTRQITFWLPIREYLSFILRIHFTRHLSRPEAIRVCMLRRWCVGGVRLLVCGVT